MLRNGIDSKALNKFIKLRKQIKVNIRRIEAKGLLFPRDVDRIDRLEDRLDSVRSTITHIRRASKARKPKKVKKTKRPRKAPKKSILPTRLVRGEIPPLAQPKKVKRKGKKRVKKRDAALGRVVKTIDPTLKKKSKKVRKQKPHNGM